MRDIGIRTFFQSWRPLFNRESQELKVQCEVRVEAKTFYKQLAIETAVNMISNTLSLAEFRTFDQGEEVRKNNYYLFNVESNRNYNAKTFWSKVYRQLVYENEALIVMVDNCLYCADSFKKEKLTFKDCEYTDVVVDDYKLNDTFFERDVFYLSMHSSDVSQLIEGLYSDHGELIEYSKNTYKRSNAKRGVLDIPTSYPQTESANEQLRDLLQNKFKDFFHAENGAVLPLTNGMQYEDLSTSTYKNGSDSRDIRNLIDDVFDYVAIAFQIPPQMLKGTVADSEKVWGRYMTQCIKPLAEMIEDEINRKFYSKEEYLSRSYVKVDTNNIKHTDLKELSEAIEKLTFTGVNTLNDNLRLLGREEIDDKKGDIRFMTLNLDVLDQVIERSENENKEQKNQGGTDQ